MKQLFFLSILSLSSLAFSAQEWKVVAETTSCDQKIQVLAKEGEKYVKAVSGDEVTKLFPKDGSVFHENTMKMTEFVSDKSSEVKYTFIQPSYVEANPPKIDVSYNGTKKRCKMDLTR
ncbi:MAG: hypothetical protein ACLGHN_07285 [Bacteriovoracia bacterium]